MRNSGRGSSFDVGFRVVLRQGGKREASSVSGLQ
jgi:hypothetical protein